MILSSPRYKTCNRMISWQETQLGPRICSSTPSTLAQQVLERPTRFSTGCLWIDPAVDSLPVEDCGAQSHRYAARAINRPWCYGNPWTDHRFNRTKWHRAFGSVFHPSWTTKCSTATCAHSSAATTVYAPGGNGLSMSGQPDVEFASGQVPPTTMPAPSCDVEPVQNPDQPPADAYDGSTVTL